MLDRDLLIDPHQRATLLKELFQPFLSFSP